MRMNLSTLSQAERIAHQRDVGRRRKANERDRLRDAGRPDAAALDRAVVEAVRDFLASDLERVRPIRPDALLKAIALRLLARSRRAYVQGAEPVVYTAEGVRDAVKARLLTPAQPLREPAKAP